MRFHPSAVVDPTAILFPGAYIGPNVTIGADCMIGPGAAIGAPGFGYEKVDNTEHGLACYHDTFRNDAKATVACSVCDGISCPAPPRQQYRTHTAGVVIERDVHIGANACVDQGRHRATVIREGARIDNLVHVGHNVEIGRHALVVALSMLGGTSEVGPGGYVASATVRDHVTVGASAVAGLGSVVVRDIPAGETWAGVPARKMPSEAERIHANLSRHADEIVGPLGPKPAPASCPKCNDTGMIPDPDRGTGNGPYWDDPCDCGAAARARPKPPHRIPGACRCGQAGLPCSVCH